MLLSSLSPRPLQLGELPLPRPKKTSRTVCGSLMNLRVRPMRRVTWRQYTATTCGISESHRHRPDSICHLTCCTVLIKCFRLVTMFMQTPQTSHVRHSCCHILRARSDSYTHAAVSLGRLGKYFSDTATCEQLSNMGKHHRPQSNAHQQCMVA